MSDLSEMGREGVTLRVGRSARSARRPWSEDTTAKRLHPLLYVVYSDGMTERARFQVIEARHGYAVKDTKDGSIWSRTYKSVGWAARAATKLNELTRNLKYSA